MTSFLPFRLVVRLFFCTFAPFIIYDIMALIKSYRGMRPKWGKECYFSENATIVGDVTMGDECSVWFNAVVRGDVAPITIGDRTNVQDGSCIHVTHDTGPTHIGSDVTTWGLRSSTTVRWAKVLSWLLVPWCCRTRRFLPAKSGAACLRSTSNPSVQDRPTTPSTTSLTQSSISKRESNYPRKLW